MTAELVRGQNHPLPHTRLEIRVSAGHPVLAAATLGDEQGRVAGPEALAHPGAAELPGVEVPRQAAARHRLAVDLEAVRDTVHRVSVLLALPLGTGGPTRFGASAAPVVTVTAPDGTGIADYTITGLDRESAVVALELYRRQDSWKVRAVGQGYEGGLAALLADQGLDRAPELAGSVLDAVAQGLARAVPAPAPRAEDAAGRVPEGERAHQAAQTQPAVPVQPPVTPPPPAPVQPPAAPSSGGPIDYTHPRRRPAAAAAPGPAPQQDAAPGPAPADFPPPVAGDASGWTMDERLYNQVWGMFEDLARATAAYRSACNFAESRLDQELDRVLSDPRSRIGGAGDAARAAAKAKHDELTDRAQEALDRDLAQLTAESEVVEPALPAAYARWDSPVWQAYRVPMEPPMAVRLGDLHLPERTGLRVPFLARLPLARGLWVDSGRGHSEAAMLLDEAELRRLALESAVAHAVRLLAVHPAGRFRVRVIDAAGAGAHAFAPLVEAGVLAGPPAAGAAGVSAVLMQLTERVDLLQMASRAGAAEDLPPGLDTAEELLIVHDFPHGFDDRSVNQLRYLADEGPSVGTHLLLVADRADAAAYGPVLDPLWRCLTRLTPVPDDHLADPWVGHAWTYEPPAFPAGSSILRQVLAQLSDSRRQWGP
ncbi:TerD family protein [Streptomyces sp. SKN60]|uniref:TerD family protein n=1 Tax=Streptomyces sp. SKN60 TaxID=2855506 RepID=UPI0022460080|nr:TerD family protein [Streptomyces sp. SKN60]MCX2183064.1 TerD family protein [Streptomyces sp. SKN60]